MNFIIRFPAFADYGAHLDDLRPGAHDDGYLHGFIPF
jgi:hypothetical protein